MKKVFGFVLGLMLVVASYASAFNFANVSSSATTLLFFSPKGGIYSTFPAVATPSSLVGPGVDVKRLIVNGATVGSAYTFDLWDSFDGTTTSAKSRFIRTFNGLATSAPQTFDFTVVTGVLKDAEGATFLGYPAVIDTGANTANVTIEYRPGITNKTQQ